MIVFAESFSVMWPPATVAIYAALQHQRGVLDQASTCEVAAVAALVFVPLAVFFALWFCTAVLAAGGGFMGLMWWRSLPSGGAP